MIASSKLWPSHGMNATSRFLPSASSPFSVAGPSAMTSPTSMRSPALTIDAVVVAGALVGAVELAQVVVLRSTLVELDGDDVGRNLGDDTGLVGGEHVTGVDGREALHTGSDERALAAQQRNGLALHVGTHERAVRVVVLEERDERGRDRHHLARRDIHVADLLDGEEVDLSTLLTCEDAVLGEVGVGRQRRVGLGDDEVVLFARGEVVDRRR